MNLGSALYTVFIGKHSYALPHEDHTILKTRGIYTKNHYPGYKYNYVYPGAARGMNCSQRSARQKNQGADSCDMAGVACPVQHGFSRHVPVPYTMR